MKIPIDLPIEERGLLVGHGLHGSVADLFPIGYVEPARMVLRGGDGSKPLPSSFEILLGIAGEMYQGEKEGEWGLERTVVGDSVVEGSDEVEKEAHDCDNGGKGASIVDEWEVIGEGKCEEEASGRE